MAAPSRDEQIVHDRQLAQNYLERPEQHRDAFATRCAELLQSYVRWQIRTRDWCPKSTSPDTFAEDAYNRALEKLQTALCKLESPDTLHAWLMRIARSSVVNELYSQTGTRKGKSAPQVISIDHLTAQTANGRRETQLLQEVESIRSTTRSLHRSDPEQLAITSQEETIMLKIFEQHSSESAEGLECGTIIAQRLEESLSVRELADMLGYPKSTVHDIIAGNMAAYQRIYKSLAIPRERGR